MTDAELIETELARKNVFGVVREWLRSRLGAVSPERPNDISKALIRFLFIKLISRKDGQDDPVFVATPSPMAQRQFAKDMRNLSLCTKGKEDGLASDLDRFIAQAGVTVKKVVGLLPLPRPTDRVTYDEATKTLAWRGSMVQVEPEIVKRSPTKLALIMAARIRYWYLGMDTSGLGLAVDYAQIGVARSRGLEAFASPFNRYFDSYCSAFPDLEVPLGSLGSFFSLSTLPENKDVYVNPPFDETLCLEAVRRRQDRTFHFIFPDWKDFEAVQILEKDERYSIKRLPKGQLKFLGEDKRLVSPCAIVWATNATPRLPTELDTALDTLKRDLLGKWTGDSLGRSALILGYEADRSLQRIVPTLGPKLSRLWICSDSRIKTSAALQKITPPFKTVFQDLDFFNPSKLDSGLPEAEFDLVEAHQALEKVEDIVGFLRSMSRVMKWNAVLIGVTSINSSKVNITEFIVTAAEFHLYGDFFQEQGVLQNHASFAFQKQHIPSL